MTGLFPHPLSSDGVDRLNHKWMVLLMLVLSLAAFIVPLHPSYRAPGHETSQGIVDEPKPEVDFSHVDVACWCPPQFTKAYLDYTNSLCKAKFLNTVKGSKHSLIYLPLKNEIPFDSMSDSVPDMLAKYLKENVGNNHQGNYDDNNINRIAQVAERERVQDDVERVVIYQTPLLVLGTALMLVLPHALWCFLAECCCSTTNLALTLASVAQACKNSPNNPNVLTAQIFNTPSKTAGALFLVKKVFSVVVVITLLLVTTQHGVVEVEQLEDILDNLTPISSSAQPSTDMNATSETTLTALDFFKPPNDVFLCDYPIRVLQNVHMYTIQCTVSVSSWSEKPITTTTRPVTFVPRTKPSDSFTQERNLLQFESAILCAVTSILAIGTVANVLNLCGWLYKLLSVSARKSLQLSGNVAMDTALLIHMARINCGLEVTNKLIRFNNEHELTENL